MDRGSIWTFGLTDDFLDLLLPSGGKRDRCCAVKENGVLADRAEILVQEKEDQMFCILDEKKSRNILHCESVWR